MKAAFGAVEFFGAVILILGLLNTMLTLRGGLASDPLNYIFIGVGIIMITLGLFKRRKR